MLQKKAVFKSYLELTKPGIIFFCVMMAVGGAVLAPGRPGFVTLVIVVLGTLFSVASANVFNMILERNTDLLMRRTRQRPLVTKKISVVHATCFAFLLGVSGVLLLAFYANGLSAFLALTAIVVYTLVYTPLKFKTPLALVVGALPGAIPPLLGWVSVSERIDWPGVALFAVLFAWQMPHFIAISLYHQEDYVKAGIQIVSAVRGEKNSKIQAFLWSLALFFSSLTLVPLKVGGVIYGVAALALGVWFLTLCLKGLKEKPLPNWPRRFFLASLVYLPVLVLSLVFDRFFSVLLAKSIF